MTKDNSSAINNFTSKCSKAFEKHELIRMSKYSDKSIFIKDLTELLEKLCKNKKFIFNHLLDNTINANADTFVYVSNVFDNERLINRIENTYLKNVVVWKFSDPILFGTNDKLVIEIQEFTDNNNPYFYYSGECDDKISFIELKPLNDNGLKLINLLEEDEDLYDNNLIYNALLENGTENVF